MSKKSLVDTGSPPDNVAEYNAKKQKILSGDDEPQNESKEKSASISKAADQKPSIGFEPKPKIRTFSAKLTHELYKITLEVLDISISDFQLALKVPRNGFKFEPLPQSSFDLKTQGKEYAVTYLGGIFDFPSDEHWTITFLIEPETVKKGSLDDQIMQALEK